jgi:nucleotide-binding universal stress UspA family protein
MSPAEGILVGYDGSRASERALSWAAREACGRAERLTVCHVWTAGEPGAEDAGTLARRRGSDILARGVATAQNAMGTGPVAPLLAEGQAAAELCALASRADMVVVGACGAGSQQGGGSVPGLLLGSVSAEVAAYAPGPVIVERGHWRAAGGYRPGHVVAGSDGSPDSQAALRFAAATAAHLGVSLQVVCALTDSPACLGGEAQLREDVGDLLTRLGKEFPGVTIMCRFASGAPLRALLEEAQEAQLAVVGRRGLGGVRGMRLGSVGQGVLNHATCPVAVVSQ